MMAITLVAAHEEGLRSFSSPKNNPLYDPPLAPGFDGDDDYFDEADATYNDNDGGGDDDGEGKDDTFDYVCSARVVCLIFQIIEMIMTAMKIIIISSRSSAYYSKKMIMIMALMMVVRTKIMMPSRLFS